MLTFFLSFSVTDPFEIRASSLTPLVAYIESKMKSMASMFGIDNDYIAHVARSIQTSVASVGFSIDDLKRHYASQGKESLASALLEKLTAENGTLPKGISAKYVVTMVSGYLLDNY